MSEETSRAYNDGENPAVRFANELFYSFVINAVTERSCPAAIFIDNNFGSSPRPSSRRLALPRSLSGCDIILHTAVYSSDSTTKNSTITFSTLAQGHYIFMRFFGSEDDRLALRLVPQMAQDPSVTTTVVRFEILNREEAANHATVFASTRDSLPTAHLDRVVFNTVHYYTGRVLSTVVQHSGDEARRRVSGKGAGAGDMVVLGQNEFLSNNILRAEMGGNEFSGSKAAERAELLLGN